MLSREVNYIVSGLERSGTSVMMQMLHAGGLPVAFDDERAADEHNPRGYYELAGGRVIQRLMDGVFNFEEYKGRIVKITAYGLKYLPQGNYQIIYMMRDLDEILQSMQKMGAKGDVGKDKPLYTKLNSFALDLMERRVDIEYITIDYRNVIETPEQVVGEIDRFWGTTLVREKAVRAVDVKLYRNRAGK